MAELLARALELSVTWWLTFTSLVIVTAVLVVAWLVRYADEWDREHGRWR